MDVHGGLLLVARLGRISSWDGVSRVSVAGIPGYDEEPRVRAWVAYHGDRVVGDRFLHLRQPYSWNMARRSGGERSYFGSGVRGEIADWASGGVNAPAVFEGKLYVGGSFTRAGGGYAHHGGKPSTHIARWDG